MFHKAVNLEFGEGTVLELAFQDGKVKKYDMAVLFDKYPQLHALTNRELFLSGQLIGAYGILWNDELDIEAETIYQEGETIQTVKPRATMRVGSAVSSARAKKGLSQKKLSETAGIDQLHRVV